MPIYEYACQHCRKIFSFLVRNAVDHRAPRCPNCGRAKMKRCISSFRIGHRDEKRLEKLADPSALSGLDERDPKSLARWMRKMGKELGEEIPEEMNEMCDRLEAGENPEDIDQAMGGGENRDAGPGYVRDQSGELYEG